MKRQFLALCIGCLSVGALPLLGDSIGVHVQLLAQFDTNGVYPGSGTGCNDPNYPACSQNITQNGLASASAIASLSGTTSSATDPAGTSSSVFASISATEGHIGMSVSGDSNGIGVTISSVSGNWMDVMTVGGNLPYGAAVELEATLNIEAEFVGLGPGPGSGEVGACFEATLGAFAICTSGSDSSNGPLTLPAEVTEQFTGYAGEQFAIGGNGHAAVETDSAETLLTDPSADLETTTWSVLATDSAHYSIQSLTPGVVLTTESGCSITNGYGCDPVPEPTPEPSSWWLLSSGVLLLGGAAKFLRS